MPNFRAAWAAVTPPELAIEQSRAEVFFSAGSSTRLANIPAPIMPTRTSPAPAPYRLPAAFDGCETATIRSRGGSSSGYCNTMPNCVRSFTNRS